MAQALLANARVHRVGDLLRARTPRYGVAATAVAGFALWLVVGVGGATATTWFDDLGEFAAAAVGAAACAVSSRRAAGRDRLPWALISASCSAWALGQLTWSWYELIAHANPFPSLADVGFLAAIPLMIAGLLSFPRLLRGIAARVEASVDAMIIASALLVISWSTALGAVYAGGADNALALALSLVYPASDIALITLAVILATRARSSSRTPLLLLAGGMAALALSDSSLAYATSINAGLTVSLDAGWFAGFVLIAMAALEAGETSEPDASRTPLPAWLRRVTLYLVVCAALGIVTWHIARGDRLDAVLFVALLAMTCLAITREALAVLASAGLLRRLVGDGVTGLPGRDAVRLRIDGALASASPPGALLCMDIDDFAAVNDRFGREAGDLVLGVVARRLDAAFHEPHVVAHLDADRFAVLLAGGTDMEDAVQHAVRLRRSLRAPIDVRGSVIWLDATIGISPLEGNGSAEAIVRAAETAARAGKGDGGRAVVVVEPDPPSSTPV